MAARAKSRKTFKWYLLLGQWTKFSNNFTETFLGWPSTKHAKMILLGCTKWPPELKIENLLMTSSCRPEAQFQNNFIEMFVEWHSTKIAKMVLLHWTKWQLELKQEEPWISISYSTEAITFMANLSSGEPSRAIMALLFLHIDVKLLKWTSSYFPER